jgi:hypothetical protein
MQGTGWAAVLSRIPAEKHDSLVIVTNTGAEIVLREIVRVENDFLIVRGRMAGSADEGRVIILPFDQVTFLAFNKMLPEAEIKAMFAQGGTRLQGATAPSPPASLPPTTPITAPSPAAVAEAAKPAPGDASSPGPAIATPPPPAESDNPPNVPGGKAPARPGQPSKSVLLARLRARLSEGGGQLPR